MTKELTDLLKINAGRARSMDKIVSALFELLKTKPYDRITVSEICAQARIARKTFYRNFESKDAVVEQKMDRIFMDFSGKYDFTNVDARSMYVYWYEYLLSDKAFASIFVDRGLFDLIVDKVVGYAEIVMEDTLHSLASFEPALAEYYLRFLGLGIASTMSLWIRNGCKTPVKTMAALTDRLMSGVIA